MNNLEYDLNKIKVEDVVNDVFKVRAAGSNK